MVGGFGVAAVVLVVAATAVIGAYGLRLSRTTSDFYVASRTVTPLWNASAIGGEYLSAASFLGVAGLVLAYGVDMLWLPVGFTGGYLILLVLVAAPLRRSGAYTLPDFTEVRLQSTRIRLLASVLVVGICWLYLMPQFQGAGLTMRTVTGSPLWVGELVVALVVVASVAAGGMRSVTFVQAFQYWLKLTAMIVPAVFLLLAWRADGSPALTTDATPHFRTETTVSVQADVSVRVPQTTIVMVRGEVDGLRYDGASVSLTPGPHAVADGAQLTFPAGAAVPTAEKLRVTTDAAWAQPLSGNRDHPLYSTYSLVLATLLGTMGLPHVLVRFYTNPDGRTARRTTLAVLALLGLFYLGPAVFGALGRLYTPELLMTGRTDAVVLLLPERVLPGLGGELLGALVVAGAFAAFLSTASGLTMSVAGVLTQDLFRGRGGIRTFRIAAVVGTAVPFALAIAAGELSVADAVSLAFAVAASTFCPLLVLGIWWKRLSTVGAVAGLLTGGVLAGAAVVYTIVAGPAGGWPGALLANPAAITVPAAFGVMIGVSLLTPRSIPPDTHRIMVRLHVPESLELEAGDWGRSRR